MANIYELTDDYLRILELMEDPELDPQLLADTMEAVKGNYEEKIDGYAYCMQSVKDDIKTIDEAIKRLQSRKQTMENNARRMGEVVFQSMKATGNAKIKTAVHTVWIQKNPESVVMDVDDWKSVPEEYLRQKDPEINKTAIKEALKAGADLSGIAHLEQTEGVRFK